MSNQSIQRNEIFAFEKGNCIPLKDFKNVQDTNQYDLGDQMTNLIQMVSSLSKTVNQNAQVLKTLSKKVDQNEFNFVNFLQQDNNNYLQYYDDQLQEKANEIKEDELVSFLLERNELLQKKMLDNINDNDKFKQQTDRKFELVQTQQSQSSYQINQLEQWQKKQQESNQIKLLKQEIEQKMNQLQTDIDACCSTEYSNKIYHELKFMNNSLESQMLDKVNDIYKQLDGFSGNGQKFMNQDQNEIWEQFNSINHYIEIQKQNNENYDQLILDFRESQKKQKKHSKVLKKLLKNKLSEQNQQRIENLENIVYKDEKNHAKMINNNVKRIELLQEQLDLKINKAQFFEFVAENFVRSKDYLNFQKNVLNNIDNFKSNQAEQQKNLQQFKYDLTDKIDDCYNGQEVLQQKVQQNSKDILNIRSIESNGERMYHSLEKKIEKLKDFFIDTYSQKLNALTTAQGLKCISCGERDLPFPPQSQFVKGEDDNTYQMKENKRIDSAVTKNTINTTTQNLDNQKNKFKLTTKNSSLKSQKMQSYNSLTQKNYVIGPQVFNKQHQVVEHYFKTHLPVDQLIEQKLYRKPTKRPQTSIPKFQR